LGNLSTPKTVQKLQKALHAKAKAEAGYRFYALYDKISREDILAHAYAQCRSNKGAPGVDGQDFADIEAYGVSGCTRGLGELACFSAYFIYKLFARCWPSCKSGVSARL
jgi:RNA-directed DNA polymerase